jgi:hypothetical protein
MVLHDILEQILPGIDEMFACIYEVGVYSRLVRRACNCNNTWACMFSEVCQSSVNGFCKAFRMICEIGMI